MATESTEPTERLVMKLKIESGHLSGTIHKQGYVICAM